MQQLLLFEKTLSRCRECGEEKEIRFFVSYQGCGHWCKDCYNAYQRRWKKKSSEKYLTSTRKRDRSLGTRYRALCHKLRKEMAEDPKIVFPYDLYLEKTAANKCTYCPSTLPEQGIGLDRLDNDKPHTPENTVPCCTVCNRVRCHLLSPRIMHIIGPQIYALLQEELGDSECQQHQWHP